MLRYGVGTKRQTSALTISYSLIKGYPSSEDFKTPRSPGGSSGSVGSGERVSHYANGENSRKSKRQYALIRARASEYSDVRPLSSNGLSQMIIGVPQANTHRFVPRLISIT